MANRKSLSSKKVVIPKKIKLNVPPITCYQKEYFCSENATSWMLKMNDNISFPPERMQGEGCFDFDTCYDQIFKSLGYQRKSSSLEEIQENLRKNQMVMVSIVPDSNLFNKKGKKIPKEKWQRHSIVIIGFDNTGIDRLESRKDGCYKYHQPYESFLREWNRIGGEQRVSRLAIIKKN